MKKVILLALLMPVPAFGQIVETSNREVLLTGFKVPKIVGMPIQPQAFPEGFPCIMSLIILMQD